MPANTIVSDPVTSAFNALRFDENPFACQCEKEDKTAKGFRILHYFYWSFSGYIMAMKGLIKENSLRNLHNYRCKKPDNNKVDF